MTNEVYTAAQPADNAQIDENQSSLIDLLQVLAEHLRLIVLAPLAIGLVALAGSFLLTPIYTATATFLPPQQQQSMASSLLQSLGSIGGMAGAAAGLKNPTDQYVSFLKSNAVEDAVIARFKLHEVYKARFKEDARVALAANTRIIAGKDNIVSIEYDSPNPVLAAAVANAFPEELAGLLGRLAITEAQQRRLFFGKQLAAAKEGLITAEQALAATGVSVAALNSNPSTALAGPSLLRAQVTAQEVKLASLRSYLTDAAPEIKQGQAELLALRGELLKAESAQPRSTPAQNSYIAKYREYKYQETLFDLFSKQYESARIDESREGEAVQVIDAAEVPDRKSRPARSLIAIIATIASGLLIVMFLYARKAWQFSLRDGNSAAKFIKLKRTLRQSLGRK